MQLLKSSELSQETMVSVDTKGKETSWIPVEAASLITRAISQRRSSRRRWLIFERITMLILDATLIDASFRFAYHLRYDIFFDSSLLFTIRNNLSGIGNSTLSNLPPKEVFSSMGNFFWLEVSIVIGLVLIFAIRGLYHLRLAGNWFLQAWIIASSAVIGLASLITYFFVFQPPSSSRLLVLFIWVVAVPALSAGRLIASSVIGLLYRFGLGKTRLLVVGSGRLGKMLMQHVAANPNLGYSIVGFLHDTDEPPGDFGRFKMLGMLEDLGMVIGSMQIEEVIIALPSHLHQESIKGIRLLERLGVSFKLVPDLCELSLSRIDVEGVGGIPLLGIKQAPLNSAQRAATRTVDIILSVLILALGLPFWLSIAAAIRLNSPGTAIYKQTRIGLNGRPFKICKFRSMYKNADQVLATVVELNEARGPLFKMKEDPRITPVGRFLRRTSLDEIPQLINVIRGEMSLVGPRPPLPDEVAQYEEWQKGRLDIKPGMTGLWQVRGRSDLSFEEGVLLDLYYIENWSPRLYYQILLRTIPTVLFSRGAY